MTLKNQFQVEWDTAMAWWREQSTIIASMVRRLAVRRLSLRLAGTGQGISSSDTNHEVFSLWQEYKRDTAHKHVCTLTWVLDKLKAIEEV